jgi:hypothetical protein
MGARDPGAFEPETAGARAQPHLDFQARRLLDRGGKPRARGQRGGGALEGGGRGLAAPERVQNACISGKFRLEGRDHAPDAAIESTGVFPAWMGRAFVADT